MRLPKTIAAAIADVDRGRLSQQFAIARGELAFSFDVNVLSSIVEEKASLQLDDRRRRSLVDRGANLKMLRELGLGVSHAAFNAMCVSTPQGYPYGRPRRPTNDDIRAMHHYWSSCSNPGRIHPVDHLLRTADHVDLRLASVRAYLLEHPAATAPLADVPVWLQVMFPDWPHAGPAD